MCSTSSVMVVVGVSHSMANSRTKALALWSSSKFSTRSVVVGLVRELRQHAGKSQGGIMLPQSLSYWDRTTHRNGRGSQCRKCNYRNTLCPVWASLRNHATDKIRTNFQLPIHRQCNPKAIEEAFLNGHYEDCLGRTTGGSTRSKSLTIAVSSLDGQPPLAIANRHRHQQPTCPEHAIQPLGLLSWHKCM